MPSEATYIVAGSKSWNRSSFEQLQQRHPGRWTFVAQPGDLTVERVRQLNPRYIFFLHWSWKVEAAIVEHYECVCFHMTDLPFGRGGSPLQNLILRGHRETKLSALRMTSVIDGGPIYLKQPLSLEGTAEQILRRASDLSVDMIGGILEKNPRPMEQRGEPTVFKRRTPEESAIPATAMSPDQLYDFIRMLDGEGYPLAFIQHGGFRYEFSRAEKRDGRVVAQVAITPVPKPGT